VSALEIFDCEQGTDDWFRVRLGMPTASQFGTVLAVGRSGGESKTRRLYLTKLAGERITARPATSYRNKYMERGTEMEPEARAFYAMLTDAKPQQVGFIRNAKKGCSPDSLIGKPGMLEIKTCEPHILIEALDSANGIPPEHMPQLQGNLWVAEREWIDLLIYCPAMPTFLRRVYRDETYIAKLAAAVDQFNNELDALTDRIMNRS
jgi:hypothetical protein